MKELSLKEVQNETFKVLLRLKEIFDENDWQYFLTYGTLLGAVRHHGFIPWDDDIDVWMPREDYEKFIDYCIANAEKLKPFELIHYRTNKKYIYPIARFSNSNYKIIYNTAKEYGLGLFVDVYPVDGVKVEDKNYIKRIKRMNRKICLCANKKMVKSESLIKNIIKYPYYLIIKRTNLNKLLERCDLLAKKYTIKECEYVQCVEWYESSENDYKKEWVFGNKEELEFNGELFRVPSNYHEVLKAAYGDYMKLPPKEQQIGHHDYKAYKKEK